MPLGRPWRLHAPARGKMRGVSTTHSSTTPSSPARSRRKSPPGRVVVSGVVPSVDDGRWPAKRTVGESVSVLADAFAEGHDLVAADVLVRGPGDETWTAARMEPLGNDRFEGTFVPDREGRWTFTIRALGRPLRLLAARPHAARRRGPGRRGRPADRRGPRARRRQAGRTRGRRGAEDAPARRHRQGPARRDRRRARPPARGARRRHPGRRRRDGVRPRARARRRPRARALLGLVRALPALAGATGATARCATSSSACRTSPSSASTSSTCRRSTRSAASTARGRNNTAHAVAGDVGSPWAIGAAEGGHTAIHPDLGHARRLRRAGRGRRASRGIEVALDIAFQCAPDHPWVSEHPEWFRARPDGTIQYAENPPKKYQDIYPFDFESAGLARALGGAARRRALLGRAAACASSASTTRTPSRSRSGSG